MAWNEPGGNGKDPWGHHKNEQGPPNLDEIVKKMQEKLGNLFKHPQGPQKEEHLNGVIIAIVILSFFALWLASGLYTIQAAEQGVVTRFGAYQKTTEQGLHWHIPYPIEQVEKVNVEQVRAIQHKALMLTQDENLVEIELVVQYQVKDAKDYLFMVTDADDTLHQATESALREIVGNSEMDKVLTTDRAKVANDTRDVTQTIIDRYKTGLQVISVNMQNAQPPQEVQDAFADVIKAREDEERLKNKAKAYANETIQKAGGLSDKLRQEAQAYKSQVIAHAEGETKRFLTILQEYDKAPEITRQRFYLETMETLLSNTSKILVDLPDGSHQLMMLELDELFNQATTIPSQETSSSPPLTTFQPSSIKSSVEENKPENVEDMRNNRERDHRDRGGRQ